MAFTWESDIAGQKCQASSKSDAAFLMALVFANRVDATLKTWGEQPSGYAWQSIDCCREGKKLTKILHKKGSDDNVWEVEQENEHHEKEVLREMIFHGAARNPGLIDIDQWSFGSSQGSGPQVKFEKCTLPDWSTEKDPTQNTIVAYGIARCYSHLHMLNIFGAKLELNEDSQPLDNVFVDENGYPRLVCLVHADILKDGDDTIPARNKEDTETFRRMCETLGGKDPFLEKVRSLESIEEICKAMEEGLMFNGSTPHRFQAYRNWFDKDHDVRTKSYRTYSWKRDDDKVTEILQASREHHGNTQGDGLPCHSLTVNDFAQILELAEKGYETAIRYAAMYYVFATDEPGNWLNAVRYARQSPCPILSVISTPLKVLDPAANFVVGQDLEAAASGDRKPNQEHKKDDTPENDLVRAFKCYSECYRRMFDVNALWRLGVLTLYVEHNRKRGLALLEEADRQNCPAASFELGMIYAKGQFVVRDEQKAVAYFQRAASGAQSISGDTPLSEIRGHKDAQYMIDLYSSKPE